MQGTYTYAGGGKYVGEFVDDKRHGQGAYTCKFAEGIVWSALLLVYIHVENA